MPRPDPGHVGTDEILAQIEKRIQAVYSQAEKEVEAKWIRYMESFAEEDAFQAERLLNGEITRQEYQNWRMRHLATGRRWEAMRDTLAEDYHNANLNAARLTRDGMADVYALNLNYGTYMIEHSGRIDTGFTLYNHKAAEALLRKEWSISPESGKNAFLPKPSAKKKKWMRENPDKLWNAEKIQSAVTQGILTGESAQDMARRLAGVGEMDKHQAIRNARTMSTNVQNYGRVQSADRAKSLGVDLVDEWVAILDHATRHSHRQMHGERKEHDPDVPFRNGCRWPGDPAGPAAEVYNCRCDLISWVKGFEGETVKHNDAMGDMTFEEWQQEKAPKPRQAEVPRVHNPYPNEMETKGYVGLSGEESDQFMEEHHNKQIIPRNHLNTMEGAQSRRINRALRKGEMPTDPQDQKMVERLDKAIQKNQLPQNMTLFRGVNVSEFRQTGIFDGWEMPTVSMDLFRGASGGIDFDAWGAAHRKAEAAALKDLLSRGQNLVGQTITDKGFMQVSASSQRNIFGFSDINIQLHAPEGMHAYISDYKEESEIILPRGTSYEILGVEISEYVASNGNRKKVLQLIARVVL